MSRCGTLQFTVKLLMETPCAELVVVSVVVAPGNSADARWSLL
jgi:hypothetical protein